MATDPITRNPVKPASQAQPDIGADLDRLVSPRHRAILRAALAKTSGRAFNELLASMPDVGEDSDFVRNRD